MLLSSRHSPRRLPAPDAFEAQLLACGLRYALLAGVTGCAEAADSALLDDLPLAEEILAALAPATQQHAEGGDPVRFTVLLLVGCAAGVLSRSIVGAILFSHAATELSHGGSS